MSNFHIAQMDSLPPKHFKQISVQLVDGPACASPSLFESFKVARDYIAPADALKLDRLIERIDMPHLVAAGKSPFNMNLGKSVLLTIEYENGDKERAKLGRTITSPELDELISFLREIH